MFIRNCKRHNRPPSYNVIDLLQNLCCVWLQQPHWQDILPLKGTWGYVSVQRGHCLKPRRSLFIAFVLEPKFTSQHLSDETHRRSSTSFAPIRAATSKAHECFLAQILISCSPQDRNDSVSSRCYSQTHQNFISPAGDRKTRSMWCLGPQVDADNLFFFYPHVTLWSCQQEWKSASFRTARLSWNILITACGLCSGLEIWMLKLHTRCSPESSTNLHFLYVVCTFLRHQKDQSDSEGGKGWKAAHRRGSAFYIYLRIPSRTPLSFYNLGGMKCKEPGRCSNEKESHETMIPM